VTILAYFLSRQFKFTLFLKKFFASPKFSVPRLAIAIADPRFLWLFLLSLLPRRLDRRSQGKQKRKLK
jgi:hypothetical protein